MCYNLVFKNHGNRLSVSPQHLVMDDLHKKKLVKRMTLEVSEKSLSRRGSSVIYHVFEYFPTTPEHIAAHAKVLGSRVLCPPLLRQTMFPHLLTLDPSLLKSKSFFLESRNDEFDPAPSLHFARGHPFYLYLAS